MRGMVLGVLVVAACSSSKEASNTSGGTSAAAPAASVSTAPERCPATGWRAECSVIYRLERAGVAPRVDATAKPDEQKLTGTPLVVKIGQSAQLELFFYPDSAARVADGAKLDRSELVDAVRPQTMKRERTLIESANVIGLLTSINAHQRERVSDAIVAGPPQPAPAPSPAKP